MSNFAFKQLRWLSSKSALVTKPHRSVYRRLYPVVLVRTDGSTIKFRYHEPRAIIKLPINVWTLSEAERKARLEKRKPKQKMVYEDELDDDFDSTKYLKYLGKKI